MMLEPLASDLEKKKFRTLVVQWLRVPAPNSGSTGLTPGGGTKILHATCVAKI